MPLRSKQRLVLVKTEGGTYGTDPSPTGSNALYILEPRDMSHHAPAPEPLSTAAQAVSDASHKAWVTKDDPWSIAAAALHAVADQVVPTEPDYMRDAIPDAYDQREETRRQILAIVAELEGHHG